MNVLYLANLPAVDQAIAHYKTQALTQQRQFLTTTAGFSDPLAVVLYATTSWTETVTKFIASMFGLFDGQNGTPEEKKAAVLAAVDKLYIDVIKPQLETAIGRPIVFRLVEPLLHSAFTRLAEGIYDGIAKVITKVTTPAVAGTPSSPAAPTTATPPGFVPY